MQEQDGELEASFISAKNNPMAYAISVRKGPIMVSFSTSWKEIDEEFSYHVRVLPTSAMITLPSERSSRKSAVPSVHLINAHVFINSRIARGPRRPDYAQRDRSRESRLPKAPCCTNFETPSPLSSPAPIILVIQST